jgi:hypothetical protein
MFYPTKWKHAKKTMFSYNQLSGIIVHKKMFIDFDILQIG